VIGRTWTAVSSQYRKLLQRYETQIHAVPDKLTFNTVSLEIGHTITEPPPRLRVDFLPVTSMTFSAEAAAIAAGIIHEFILFHVSIILTEQSEPRCSTDFSAKDLYAEIYGFSSS
jgi:hypothetical protein